MKIALVVHDFDPRFGQGRYAVELARRLAVQHDVHVYANRFAAPLSPNVTFQKVRAWRRTAVSTILTFLVKAEARLRRQDYDLIHAQGLTCWHADVITAHICNQARYQDGTPTGVRNRLFPALILPLERRFYQQQRARHLIAVSRKVAGEIAHHYGWRRPESVIYHGTDSSTFHPATNADERRRARARYQLEPAAWVWLFTGEAVKGLRLVIEQLAHFPEATLLVISRSQLEPYRTLATALGVGPRVRFHGVEEETAVACQAADVFVYPSSYDAFGLVVAEAMATKLPVVVGKDIGAAEWIEPGRNGLVCDPRTTATLRQQLEWLRAHPERAQSLGEVGRETVMKHSWDACAEATLAVYEQVRTEKGRP